MPLVDISATVLVALGCAAVFVGCAGILIMPDVFSRIHYIAPASSVGAVLVGIGLILWEGLTPGAAKIAVAIAAVVIGSPVTSHATIRCARIRTRGSWHDVEEELDAGRAVRGATGLTQRIVSREESDER